MGKSRKKLAVLLAAAMTLSMTFGMTAFAADDTVPGEPVPAVEAADTEPGIPEPVTVTEPDPDVPTDTTVTEPVPMDTTLTEPVPAGTTPTGSVPAADDPAGPETTSTNDIPDVPSAPDNTVPLNDDTETPDNDTDGSTLPSEGDIPNDGGQTEGGLVAEVTEVEEEPTEVSIAGSDNLTQSDSFVSLGEGKGSYQYDGETLILKDAQMRTFFGQFRDNVKGVGVPDAQQNHNASADGAGFSPGHRHRCAGDPLNYRSHKNLHPYRAAVQAAGTGTRK